MAGLEKNSDFSGKTKSPTTSSFFNRSLTIHGRTAADSNPKPHNLNPSLNRTTSITKFYTPVESVGSSLKGKVKNLCRLFESSKPVKPPPPELPQKQKSGKSLLSESRISPFSTLNNSVIRLPGTEDRIVVYFTSLRGIRRTFEDCYAVRMIFRGFRVWIDERDVSMDIAYRKELQIAMGEKSVSLPQVFIMGKYVGGADVVKSLFEIGELAKILKEFPMRQPGFVCHCCGDIRFVPCSNCSGSKKLFDEDEDRLKRCPDCNENGLIRCPHCSS
ncbi:PREDICTED: uncharacterized protein At5g39865-like [Camelina sativa]|uniref:Uncharacterized protein At5g39865-like n=1 Tax=Camelina sativa TaxID=90675 RepID=A0ABM0VAV1_CAMSA|nr:PREDICTED: uncharacterized protein At5g39865-like [Camelina sativa]XP_019090733.1 PREDICTED: uncharacterized protein At5g39865-like [Camelina sativa]